MARTQSERSTDSRLRILDAAVTCLVERGYAATTTLQIQQMAGVSRGGLLHHFPSREQLLVAAAQHLADTRLEETLLRAATELPEGPERVDRAVELIWETYQQPHFWAAVELWTAARTDPLLAATLLPAERRLGAAIRDWMARVWGPELAARPGFPLLRELLVTSMRGVALTYAFDRRPARTDPHVEQWKRTARAVLEVTTTEAGRTPERARAARPVGNSQS